MPAKTRNAVIGLMLNSLLKVASSGALVVGTEFFSGTILNQKCLLNSCFNFAQ